MPVASSFCGPPGAAGIQILTPPALCAAAWIVGERPLAEALCEPFPYPGSSAVVFLGLRPRLVVARFFSHPPWFDLCRFRRTSGARPSLLRVFSHVVQLFCGHPLALPSVVHPLNGLHKRGPSPFHNPCQVVTLWLMLGFALFIWNRGEKTSLPY